MEPLLRVEQLTKQYVTGGLMRQRKKITALAGVSFVLHPQKTLALLGESGSGKSTLALCIACLEAPSSGRICFAGQEITRLRERQLRGFRPQIQLVFQDPVSSLNPRLTVLDIVTEPLHIQGTLREREKSERGRELLDSVGVPQEKASRKPPELSGGQKQRVAIARALALQPKLLILDEPLSALDCSLQAQVANLLMELQNRLGLSYLFITHDVRMAAHLADEIAVMQRGQIVEMGARDKLLQNPAQEITRQMIEASRGRGSAAALVGER